jgi:arginyl-tRNA--protein-N-Asp/Glu arginylyltransferase
MQKLSTYTLYSKYIDGLYEVLKNSTKTFQDYDKNLQKNWLEGAKFLN